MTIIPALFADRKVPDRFGAYYGVKRRWFGLESNRSYRGLILRVFFLGARG